MIAVRRGTEAWAVLAALVAYGEPMTVEELTNQLAPPPKWEVGKMPYLAFRTQMNTWMAEAPERTQKISRFVGRLQEVGLVAKRGPPQLAPWLKERLQRSDNAHWDTILLRLHPHYPAEDAALSEHHRNLVRTLVEKSPPSLKALLGKAPSGALHRAYTDLVEWGAILAPHQRAPTPKGILLIQGHHQRAA